MSGELTFSTRLTDNLLITDFDRCSTSIEVATTRSARYLHEHLSDNTLPRMLTRLYSTFGESKAEASETTSNSPY